MSTVALSTKAPGDIVKTTWNGKTYEFYVESQGAPSVEYSGFDGGTLLYFKDIPTTHVFDQSSNDYAASEMVEYLLNEETGFLAGLDPTLRAQLMTVKIPYTNGTYTSGTVQTGVDRFPCKAFLASYTELGLTGEGNVEGVAWPTFTSQASRIAYLDGTATYYYTRTPGQAEFYTWVISSTGAAGKGNNTRNVYGVRPAIVLPSTLTVSEDGEILLDQPPPTPVITPPDGCVWGVPATATCTAVQDPEGETVTYEWGMSMDNEVWMPLQASGTSCTYTPFADHYLRVQAVDTAGNASGYDTTALITVQRWGGQIIYGGGA